MAKRKSTNRSRTRPSSASSAAKAGGKSALSVKSDNKKKRSKTASSRRRAEKIDALKPKKPPTAFFYFLEDFRKEYQEQNPDVKSMRDIGKACGEKWNTMTYEEKVQYYDIATEKRAEFDAAMAEFVRRKESGELDQDDSEVENDSEFEDDSDFDG